MDLESLEKKYADRPSQLESIKEKTYRFWDHIRGCYLYEDVRSRPSAKGRSTSLARMTRRRSLLQARLLGRGRRPSQKGDGEDRPTIKAPLLKKLTAAAESINSKGLSCLDLIDKARALTAWDQRAPIYADIQKKIAADVPEIFGMLANRRWAYRDYVQGFTFSPVRFTGEVDLYTLAIGK